MTCWTNLLHFVIVGAITSPPFSKFWWHLYIVYIITMSLYHFLNYEALSYFVSVNDWMGHDSIPFKPLLQGALHILKGLSCLAATGYVVAWLTCLSTIGCAVCTYQPGLHVWVRIIYMYLLIAWAVPHTDNTLITIKAAILILISFKPPQLNSQYVLCATRLSWGIYNRIWPVIRHVKHINQYLHVQAIVHIPWKRRTMNYGYVLWIRQINQLALTSYR
jgi:hypothetical protein